MIATNRRFFVNGRIYYAKKSGALIRDGFYTIPSGKKVFAKDSGELMADEVFAFDGERYYADADGYIVSRQWVTVGNYRYYCSASRRITKVEKI